MDSPKSTKVVFFGVFQKSSGVVKAVVVVGPSESMEAAPTFVFDGVGEGFDGFELGEVVGSVDLGVEPGTRLGEAFEFVVATIAVVLDGIGL